MIGPVERASATAAQEADCHPVVEELISKQVARMRARGKSRAEAEELVLRFLRGRNYLHVVDAIYPPSEEKAEPPSSSASDTKRKRRKMPAPRSLFARN